MFTYVAYTEGFAQACSVALAKALAMGEAQYIYDVPRLRSWLVSKDRNPRSRVIAATPDGHLKPFDAIEAVPA